MIENRKEVRHPVIEVFGPTMQGEGYLIGQPVHFIRFGGCDYSCSWCDSKYAVIPAEVKKNATHMTDHDLYDNLQALNGDPKWVVFSGGNPALQHLDGLVDLLHGNGYKLTVETQGTVSRPWLRKIDHVTVSPKPPSSDMPLVTGQEVLDWLLDNVTEGPSLQRRASVKVVTFNDEDYAWARSVLTYLSYRGIPAFLSVGNNVGNDGPLDLIERWRWLTEKVCADPKMGNVRVLPQGHVLLWGNARGV